MNIDEVMGSHLKAEDLQGRDVGVVMSQVVMQEIHNQATNQKEMKPVLFFEGKQKGLILNVTNKNTIREAFGPDTDHWAGKPVTLLSKKTDYAGSRVACIRIGIPVAAAPPAPAPAAPVAAPAPPPSAPVIPDTEPGTNSDIPF